ncbi:MAG: aminomethyl-transferring glycine dehydrogenase subunit GcvPB [Candidatus Micrarchaeota archaeon]
MSAKLVFELKGRNSEYVPTSDVELPEPFNRTELPLPDLGEAQVVRHFIELSKMNYGVDSGFYPLGSCTMKYNPKVNEDVARLGGFAGLHPLARESDAQGALGLMYELERDLCEITGMDAFTLQPAAGAHGELTSVMIARKYFKGKRKEILIPDTAHGTNPASGAMAGFKITTVKSNARGGIDLEELRKAMSENVAMLMVTNPNTLGLFEEEIGKIAEIVHEKGALLYCDGANLNAMMGITRPGEQEFDIMHLNLHKTFSTPHGGGGPGSGPVGVKKFLEEYLPVPRVVKNEKDGRYSLKWKSKNSIGKVCSFYGNFGVMIKAYAYIKALGPKLKEVSEMAVLNANYLMNKLKPHYELPYDRVCAHEFVLSAKRQAEKGVHAMDIAKRLLDYRHHAPTIYFPLVVPEALMIEPTETERKEKLDEFADAMIKIANEPPELVRSAPLTTPVGRLDGVAAARQPNLRWCNE